MAKLSKNRKDAFSKVDSDSKYSTLEAAKLVKETSTEKFDASV
ncbi:MAG: 50S ribosomal protein L1, partial [Flavobacteriales bacterium]|nr:50S ribosomal protein L1 [Flavobacteriales bacterium]